jgi:hypothetical protein
MNYFFKNYELMYISKNFLVDFFRKTFTVEFGKQLLLRWSAYLVDIISLMAVTLLFLLKV